MSIDPKLIDVQFQPDGMIEESPASMERALKGAGAKDFPDKLLIDRSEWDDRIREMEEQKAFAEHFSPRFTHQGNSHECVCHASTQAFECAYNRQLGNKNPVRFSPLSLYTRITGGRQWGGSMVSDALYELIENGHIPEYDGEEWMGGHLGQKERFRASLHLTSGRSESWWPTSGWVKPRDLPSGWEQTARHFRVLEAFWIPDRAAHFSALLRGMVVVNGRDGHSIPHMAVVKDGGSYLSKYKDSYDVFRYDSERKTGGGYAIRAVTMPDDPNKPAGEDMR